MKKIIPLLSLMLYSTSAQAMKRPRLNDDYGKSNKQIKADNTQDKPTAATSFPFSTLPSDLRNTIIECAVLCTIDGIQNKKPKEGIQTYKNFRWVNKEFNAIFTKQILTMPMSDTLIDRFAFKYLCSHETIACYFNTPPAKERLKLQYSLKALCFLEHGTSVLEKKLDQLITDGVNLEFTYNSRQAQKTILMISPVNNPTLFPLLLKKGANINGYNTYGITTLMSVLTANGGYDLLDSLLQHPNLALNQQNKRGETALHYMLRKKKGKIITPYYITAIRELLKHPQTDLELRDKHGHTPYSRAQDLEDWRIIINIKEAITRKKSLSTTDSI